MKMRFGVVFFTTAVFVCCSASPGDPEKKENTPIPRNMTPLKYTLLFEVNMMDHRNLFSGTATINMQCKYPTNQIILNAKDLEIFKDDVEVEKHIRSRKCIGQINLPIECLFPSMETAIPLDIADQFPDEEKERYVILLQNQLKKDDFVTVRINYKKLTSLGDPDMVFLRYSYKKTSHMTKKSLVVTKSGAVNARRLYPCVDERDLKTPVTVIISAHRNFINLSNTYIEEKETRTFSKKFPNFLVEEYNPTIPLSTFSIGFFIGDFMSKDEHAPVRIWADEDVLEQTDYAKRTAVEIFEFYQALFKNMDDVHKIDIVALPDYGRTDKWMFDFITVDESSVLNPDVRSTVQQIEIAFNLCDVLSHQYFLPQTNISKWSENWLNVGLALFFRSPCFEKIFPDLKKNLVIIDLVESIIRITDTDPEKLFHPLMLSDSQINLTTLFENTTLADIAYALVRMLNFIVGESENVLRKGAQKLIVNSRSEVFNLKEIWKLFDRNEETDYFLPRGITLQTIMDSWTTTNGIPIIRLTRVSGRKVKMSQEPLGTDNEGNEIFKYVPLAYSMKSELKSGKAYRRRVLKWLKDEPVETDLHDYDWIIHNSELDVLCRYMYDKSILDQIEISLGIEEEYNIIPLSSRVQLVSDLFALAETNKYTHYSYSTVLRILKNLKYETSVLPLMVALHEFDKIRLRLLGSDILFIFQDYVRHILQSLIDKKAYLFEYESIGELGKDNYDEYYWKKLLVTSGCTFGIESFIHQSRELFIQWQNAESINAYPIPEALRLPVYCTAIREGGKEEWNFLWSFYKRKNLEKSDYTRILNALACTKEPAQLAKFLEWSVDADKIAPVDSLTVFKSMGTNREGYPLMVQFLEYYFDDILTVHADNRSNVYFYIKLTYEITWNQYDLKNLEQLNVFFEEELPDIQTHVKESKMKAEKNILWYENNEKDITSFLKSWKTEKEEEEEKEEEANVE